MLIPKSVIINLFIQQSFSLIIIDDKNLTIVILEQVRLDLDTFQGRRYYFFLACKKLRMLFIKDLLILYLFELQLELKIVNVIFIQEFCVINHRAVNRTGRCWSYF